jgi:hypothetical protein
MGSVVPNPGDTIQYCRVPVVLPDGPGWTDATFIRALDANCVVLKTDGLEWTIHHTRLRMPSGERINMTELYKTVKKTRPSVGKKKRKKPGASKKVSKAMKPRKGGPRKPGSAGGLSGPKPGPKKKRYKKEAVYKMAVDWNQPLNALSKKMIKWIAHVDKNKLYTHVTAEQFKEKRPTMRKGKGLSRFPSDMLNQDGSLNFEKSVFHYKVGSLNHVLLNLLVELPESHKHGYTYDELIDRLNQVYRATGNKYRLEDLDRFFLRGVKRHAHISVPGLGHLASRQHPDQPNVGVLYWELAPVEERRAEFEAYKEAVE